MELAFGLSLAVILAGVVIVRAARGGGYNRVLYDLVQTRGGRIVRTGELELEVGTMVVRVSTFSAPPAATHWRVRYPVSGVCPFSVVPGAGPPTEHAFAGQDIVIGVDDGFDQRYVVRGQDPLLLRRMWSADACRALLAIPGASVVGSRGGLEIERRGEALSTDELERGLELVAALDACDLCGAEALRALGGYQPPAGPFDEREPPRSTPPGPGEVTVLPVYVRGAAATRAVAVGQSAMIGDGGPLAGLDLAAAGIADEIVRRTGDAVLVQSDGELTLTWPQIVHDVAALRAGVELVRGLLRAPSQGPYR